MIRGVTFKGTPLTLVGRNLQIETRAPDFKVVSSDLKEVSLLDFEGKIKIITSFPSLDTEVCDLQVKEFNKRASSLSKDVVIVGISKDLPFAQKRFCESFDIQNIKTLSDYKTSSFGINYGVLIKELNLLARAVFIVDKENVLRYIQVVEELTKPPSYEEVMEKLKEVIKSPKIFLKEEKIPSKCIPCERKVFPLAKDKVESLLVQVKGWNLIEDKKIGKEFKFKDFLEAKYFLDLITVLAEDQGHHPTLTLIYGKLKVTLSTHAAGGVTENDFIMAKMIDELA